MKKIIITLASMTLCFWFVITVYADNNKCFTVIAIQVPGHFIPDKP